MLQHEEDPSTKVGPFFVSRSWLGRLAVQTLLAVLALIFVAKNFVITLWRLWILCTMDKDFSDWR